MSELPSRRYTCVICERKWRRNNSPESRKRDPICPMCLHSVQDLERLLIYLPRLIKYRKYKNDQQ